MKTKVRVIRLIGAIVFVLAIVFLYWGVKGITNIRPDSDYEDMGVHTFVPDRVLPVSVENTSTGRDKRLYPTKTVYVVYYQALDGSGYQWKVETGNKKSDANQILYEGKSVKQRVLSIKDTKKYITVEDELTIDTYVKGQLHQYIWMVGLSIGYLIFCLVVWMVIKRRKNNKTEE